MRKLTMFLCVVFTATALLSCDNSIETYASDGWVTKYYDSEWNLTYNKKEAKYYRISFFNNERICCDSLSSEYNIDKTKLFEGYYFQEHRDSLHGVCKWLRPDGGIVKKYSYEKGVIDGEQCEYYYDNTLKLQYHITDGSYDKEYTSYFQNGNVKERKQYTNGKLNGEHLIFRSDGTPLKKVSYLDDILHGDYIEYYETEERIREKKRYNNGRLTGEHLIFRSDGSPLQIVSYIDDILHGDYIEYYETNGNIKEKKRYNRGQLTGEYTLYYPDGQTKEKKRLINDVLSGGYYEYFPNGLVKTSGNYTSGNKTGTWTYYEENGRFSVHQNRTYRTGARCRDGSTSGATGRGACSHHGGVSYWLTTTSMVMVRQGQR